MRESLTRIEAFEICLKSCAYCSRCSRQTPLPNHSYFDHGQHPNTPIRDHAVKKWHQGVGSPVSVVPTDPMLNVS